MIQELARGHRSGGVARELLKEGVPRLCRVCGYGHYRPEQVRPGSTAAGIRFWPVGS